MPAKKKRRSSAAHGGDRIIRKAARKGRDLGGRIAADYLRKARRPPAMAVAYAGWVAALGDSWFNYFWTDICVLLKRYHGIEPHPVATGGNRIEAMAHDERFLKAFLPLIGDTFTQKQEMP